MSSPEVLKQQAALVRAAGTLGKPGPVPRLFDFLLERSLEGQSPKELEIAMAVFGKPADFDVSQDSLVRVYVHKLRRRLEAHYARAPNEPRLVVPKGQYRLSVDTQIPPAGPITGSEPEAAPLALPVAPAPQPAVPASWTKRSIRTRLVQASALVLAALVGAVATWFMLPREEDGNLRALRSSAIWAPLLADDLPITIVLGDYYLLGETDQSSQVRRLVREFFINSSGDLLHQMEVNPEHMQRYRDLSLTYLPTSSAFALQDVVPILAAKRAVRVVMMSDLNVATLKNSHILYIGYISGLGMLGDSVFAGSRLSLGGSYDELVDASTRTTYVSSSPSSEVERYTDYGYFSSFPGPNHNRIVIVAGTRDLGVMHTAEAVTQLSSVAQMTRAAGRDRAFESLFEVRGLAKASLDAKLLFVSGLKTTHFWDGE
jgi:hypothetical protein